MLDRRELLGGMATLAAAGGARASTSPLVGRVLLIDLDDLGWTLLERAMGLGGAPNLANVMATGRTYPAFWAAPVCSLFRARVLTGLDAYRPGNLVGRHIAPSDVFSGPTGVWLPDGLPGTRVKIGKWHVSTPPTFPASLITNGWDRFQGITNNLANEGGSYYSWVEHQADSSGTSSALQTQHNTSRTAALVLAELQAGTELVHASFQAVHAPLELPPNGEPAGKVYSGTTPDEVRLDMLFHLDFWLGEVLAEAGAQGYLVLIACDNGTDGAGKGTNLESGNRTPLFAWGSGVVPGVSQRLIAATDLWATVRRARGDSSGLQAADSFDFLDDVTMLPQITPPREFLTLDWFPYLGVQPPLNKWSRMIRDKRWKYVSQKLLPGSPILVKLEALRDLQTDPLEQVNLLDGPLSGEAQAALDLLLANLQQ